ncbi:MAG: dethiobiotin synthase [Bacteroidota bacterium]|nr:dethiobiotin synthase [Bacteroidota bacterium]
MKPIFITGTGTGVGKSLVAAIVTEALHADYWKPIQAGYEEGTDSLLMMQLLSNKKSHIHAELYRLKMAASPHIAAKAEGKKIKIKEIIKHLPKTKNQLVIEGAGGLMVPINKKEFVLDIIKKIKARVIIVSKNELGSINHSLMTAAILKKEKIDVAGWIFTEEYLNYENDITNWSGYPLIGSVKHLPLISRETVKTEADRIKKNLQKFL